MIVFQNIFNILVSVYYCTTSSISVHYNVVLSDIGKLSSIMFLAIQSIPLLLGLNLLVILHITGISAHVLFFALYMERMHALIHLSILHPSHSLITTQDTSYFIKADWSTSVSVYLSTHVLPIKITKYTFLVFKVL